MTVKELIEKLSKLDEDLEVVVRDVRDGHDYTSVDVEGEGVYDGAAAAVIEFLY